MEEYINNDTIIKEEIYNLFKNTIICSLCKNILIDPVMCMQCQDVFCKKCLEKNNENKCPKGCNENKIQKCIGKNDILSKLKFKCVGCSKAILYNEAINHHESCCPGKKSSDIVKDSESNQTPNGRKIERLSSEEIEELKKDGKEILYITGNYNLFILIFYSHNFGKCRCRKIKFNKYVRYIY